MLDFVIPAKGIMKQSSTPFLAFQQKVHRLPYPVLPLLLFIHLEQGQQYVKGVGSIPGDIVPHSLSISPTLELLVPLTALHWGRKWQ